MDSGNSASIQSSSGGDEDFESSRGESISSFFTPSLNPQFLARQNPNFFDDSIWPAGLRSSTLNFPNFGGLNPAPSSSSHQQSQFFPIQSPPPPPPRADSDGHGSSKPPPDSQHQHNLSAVVKNPKKRTRASRRAPTTVLTTDTTNFRQMVQEFTGIPSSPFGGASPYSRRLDLFSSPSSAAAAALRLGGHFDTLGPLYSLRPQFPPPAPPPPHQANSPPPRLNSTMIDSIVPSTSMINPNSNPDHLLSLQNPRIPLELGGNPFGNGRDQNGNDEEDENVRRWKSGETVKNHDGNEENVATTAFDHDGNIGSSRSHHHHHQHQHQHQISNMSLKNLAEKGMGSNGNNGGGSSSSGTVASWIYPSQ